MLAAVFPRQLDNGYRGHRLGLWLFGLVAAMKGTQSLSILFNGYSIARGADGVPLESFSPEAAQTIVSIFAQGSLWRLFFCLVGGIALVRYRSAVPGMFALFALQYVAAWAAFAAIPLPRVGEPVGPVVNGVLFVLMLVGLGLSLRRRGGSDAHASRA
jgi:hypothetical protein